MNDLIRRQDAINVIDDMFMEDERYKVLLKLDINNLPSAPMDAIPIDWIEKWLERYSYRNYRREIIEFMVTEWKHEQEKQNDSFDKCG